MSETASTKVCPLCAETIKAAAKVCPYCRKSMRWWVCGSQYDLGAMACVLGTIFIAGVLWSMFSTGHAFSPGRDKLEMLNPSVAILPEKNQTNVVITGIITNESNYAWQFINFEVRFFDRSGALIDVDSFLGNTLVLRPHEQQSFKGDLTPSDWSSGPLVKLPDYSRFQVVAVSAEDPSAWFGGNND